jgi:hypothetical protein
MRDGERFVLLAALAGVAWWLYTRSQGLTLAGQYANPMYIPPASNKQSLVTPSGTTGTLATNVFSQIGQVLQSTLRAFTAQPANGPAQPAPSSTISLADVSRWGLQVPPDEPPPPSTAAVLNTTDPSLDTSVPYWSWGFDRTQLAPGVPLMSWTLNPDTLGFDPSYIPPPPGS